MPTPKDERVFEEPVAWLFGRQLLAGAKWILLYTAFGTKLDARDWMQANEFSFELKDGEQEFWFDYLSDTGDGMTATYSLAYLCLSDLHADARVVGAGTLELPDAKADVRPAPDAGDAPLPRGQFLFIGGDTAYHMSDFQSLVQRIQVPFRWAFADHRARAENFDIERRPVFGIPGNHDYYDQLDGFRRQFRLPVRSEDHYYKEEEFVFKAPQLMLSGFKRRQEASYVALRLPFGWRMWGLDTEVGRVDERQQKFFKSLCDPHPTDPEAVLPPDKLIVATCAPTTVFGKLADKEDEKSADAFAQLGLEQPFLPAEDKLRDGGPGLEAVTGDARLEDGQCRLDISGDVHHYARYWGPKTGADTRPGRGDVEAPSSESYASVVSGIGGAFHHPSQTFRGQIREQALYPAEEPSRAEVARRIFKFWNIRRGGAIHIFGFVIAFVLYFSASVPQSSSQVINAFPPLRWLGVPIERPNPNTGRPEPNTVTPTINAPQTPALGPSGASAPRAAAAGGAGTSPSTTNASPRYMYGPNPVTMPPDFWVGLALLGAALAAMILAFVFSDRLFGARRRTVESENDEGGREFRHKRVDPEVFDESGRLRVLVLTVVVTALTGVGFWMIKPYRDFITPFGNSLLVLFTVVWAAAAAVLGLRYGEWLFKQAARRTVHKHEYWLQSVLAVLAVLCVGVGVWSFGRNNLPALLLSDMLFVFVIVGAPLAILGMALALGATGMTAKGKLLMLALGVWHAILQVFVPFLLVRKGNWVTWAAAVALFFLPALFGGWMMRRNWRVPLLLAWVAYGVLMLLLPRLTAPDVASRPYFYEGWMGWVGIWPSLLAAFIGAVWACVCFGLYLGVALSFHGHNNEAGGAARIERFKEFIRFRLNKDGLTGFVIAVDDPQKDGATLRPRLVDVFTLSPKGAAKP